MPGGLSVCRAVRAGVGAVPGDGRRVTGAIIGIQMASAYVGSTFIPPLFGLLGNAVSFSILPVYLLGFVVLMITMVETTFRITRKEKVVKI